MGGAVRGVGGTLALVLCAAGLAGPAQAAVVDSVATVPLTDAAAGAASSPAAVSPRTSAVPASDRGDVVRGVAVTKVTQARASVRVGVRWDSGLIRRAGKHRYAVRVLALPSTADAQALTVTAPTVVGHKITSRPKSTVKITVPAGKREAFTTAGSVIVSVTQLQGPKSSPRYDRAYTANNAPASARGRACGSRLIKPGSSVARCQLIGAYLANLNLNRVNASRADLTSVVLDQSSVRHTKFANADFTGLQATNIVGRPASLPTGWELSGNELTPTPTPSPTPTPTPTPEPTQTPTPSEVAQTVAFGTAPTVVVGSTGTATATVTTPASGGGAITYSSETTDTCTINPSTGLVTGIDAGTDNCTIKATAAAVTGWLAGEATQQFSIGAPGAGTLDSTFGATINTGLNDTVTAMAVQPDGKIVLVGNFTSYNGTTAGRIIRLNTNGSPDTSFNTGTGFASSASTVAIQSDGKIVVGGSFTSYNGQSANRIVRLNSDGTIDTTFTSPGTGLNGAVNALAIGSSGKILVGGSFTSFNDGSTTTTINRIARLNSDSTLDTSFPTGSSNGFNNSVTQLVIQSDGQILVAGSFSTYAGNSAKQIVRLSSDGVWDSTLSTGTGFDYNPLSLAVRSNGNILLGGGFSTYKGSSTGVSKLVMLTPTGDLANGFGLTGSGLDSTVNAIFPKSDGQILIGGNFTSYNGSTANRIARLNSDGTLDTGFATATGFNNAVFALAPDPVNDTKVITAGVFTSFNSNGIANRVARLDSDGSLDTTFASTVNQGLNQSVSDVATQSDGKLVVCGAFQSYNGTTTMRITRLNPNGSLDPTYLTGAGFDNTVNKIVMLSNGQLLAGGDFTTYNGTTSSHLARLNSDGTLDNTFSIGSGFDGSVYAIAVQSDGKILVGGNFSKYQGSTASKIIRLNADGTRDTTFANGQAGANGIVSAITIDSAGIYIGGSFTSVNSTQRTRIARLTNTGTNDGALDTTFASAGTGPDNPVYAIAVQSDEKVILGGIFGSYAGTSSPRIVRLTSTGTIDTDFAVGAGFNSNVFSLLLQSDGAILVGGDFTTYQAAAANHLTRLTGTGALDTSFTTTGTGLNDRVNVITAQSDTKILVGGSFTDYNASPIATRIARFYA